ncbi:hypothetical protein Q5P01_011651 [Channa striata]|uniref:Uncharacterized protein n=1 Tax=Channa striata TaxID=64152 RepID=A0AA88SQZ1_CHASR|nr:hypothetical protein Q5P01_011651 [Channa striata]
MSSASCFFRSVMCSARNRKVLENQRMVAGRDEDVRRLEGSGRELDAGAEQEAARRGRVTCRWGKGNKTATKTSSAQLTRVTSRVAVNVGAATPAHISPKCHETAETFPHQHARSETPSSEGDGAAGGQLLGCTTSPGTEDTSDSETVIKWECNTVIILKQTFACPPCTVRRNFRYSKPDLAAQGAAMKSLARSRQRRKRAKCSVRRGRDVWTGIAIDVMSDEEDGTCEGVSGSVVRPPYFRSQALTEPCANLQARVESNPKYTATHHRHLQIGPRSHRLPPNTQDSDAAKKKTFQGSSDASHPVVG